MAAVLTAMAGPLALLGWITPASAGCLVLVGAALWLLAGPRPHRVLASVLGALVVAITAPSLVGYVVGAVDAPGRMAAMTAVSLMLLGAGLVAAAWDLPTLLQVLGLAAFAIGYLALLGHLFGESALYSIAGQHDMRLPGAIVVVCAAIGLLATRHDRGLIGFFGCRGSAGHLVRRAVPFLLVGAAGLGAIDVAAERAGVFQAAHGTVLLALTVICLGVAVVWRAAVVIERAERAREASASELHRLSTRLRAQVETFVATALDAIVTVDARGTITAANDPAAQMFGRPVGDLLGKSVDVLLPERFRDRHAAHRRNYSAAPRLRPMGVGMDLVARRADGSEFPVAVSLAPMPGDGQQLVLATVRDLTDVRAAEASARESAHRFAAAFEEAPVGMLLVDLDGRVRQVNQALATMLDTQREPLIGQDFIALVDPRDLDDDVTHRAALLAGLIHHYQHEIRLLDVDGAPVWTLISTALVRDATGEPAHLVLHVEDIRARKQFEGRLQYLADHDPLTGLYNRRRFDQELSQHLAEHVRYGGGGAVLLLDLDNFKYVNDTLGHSSGDALIRAVATALRRRIREADILARLGGDEFALLLPAANVVEAQAVADAILAAVRADGALDLGSSRARTTVSIGIAMLGDEGVEQSAEALLAAADLAMYAAKEEGKDRAVVYDPAGPHLARAQAQFRWLDRIHTALEQNLLTLHAQPIVEVATGEVTQVELLLRMREGDALIPPGRFLYIAERHGLGPAIDRWVLRRAVQYAAGLTGPGAPRVEVNLSADSLADPDLPGMIADLLAEYQVPPTCMVFEVTETAAIANIDQARVFVERVAELGCRFALDDFGAGFGSFYYLKYLPFDYLKIDGEFIRQLTTSDTDQLIVTSIVAAARGLGKRTIAEYVGDAETLSLLGQLGVDFAQGYHLGRPAAAAHEGMAAASAAPDVAAQLG